MNTINAATLTKQLNARALTTRSNTLARPRAGWLQELFTRWQAWRRIRRDEHWLMSQPDHLLRDLGINRAEIETLVRRGR